MQFLSKKNIFVGLLFIIITVNIFIIIGFYIKKSTESSLSSQSKSIDSNTLFSLLDKNIMHTQQKDLLINFTPLRRDLSNYISTQSGTIGVYFDYIPTGNSIGLNEKIPFVYASLLKVPLIMAIYKKTEANQLSLSDTIVMTEEDMDPDFGTLWKNGPGTEYTIKELIDFSLIDSDDTAYNLLKKKVSLEEFANVFEYLDVRLEVVNEDPAVSAKNYTSILRSLYFSSFLSLEHSQEILNILSKSAYKDGIRKYIPATIPIANKMGIKAPIDVLSDCGIIYHPNRPYFLCIMVQIKDDQKVEDTISEISRKIYQFITSNQ